MYLRKKSSLRSRNSAKHLHGGLWEIAKFLTFLVTTVYKLIYFEIIYAKIF